MKPTIGRIVHFHPMCAWDSSASEAVKATPPPLIVHAAIVVGVHEVDGIAWPVLRVLSDSHPSHDFHVNCAPGGYEREGVTETEVPTMGHWSWPPRV